jgi:hypothetical protein
MVEGMKARPRPAVMMFARAMEDKLKRCDHRNAGWAENPMQMFFINRLFQEAHELRDKMVEYGATTPGGSPRPVLSSAKIEALQDECVDVANFAMMVFDQCRKYGEGVA